MDFESILLRKENWIATLTLNRPERLNAVTPKMAQELLVALEELDQDDETRVLVLTEPARDSVPGRMWEA
jgi:enoyl-CoA hydratase/carnithine racemase